MVAGSLSPQTALYQTESDRLRQEISSRWRPAQDRAATAATAVAAAAGGTGSSAAIESISELARKGLSDRLVESIMQFPIALRHTRARGRYAVAKRRIETGEMIMACEPYVLTPLTRSVPENASREMVRSRADTCLHCYREFAVLDGVSQTSSGAARSPAPVAQVEACKQCRQLRAFCSDRCRQLDEPLDAQPNGVMSPAVCGADVDLDQRMTWLAGWRAPTRTRQERDRDHGRNSEGRMPLSAHGSLRKSAARATLRRDLERWNPGKRERACPTPPGHCLPSSSSCRTSPTRRCRHARRPWWRPWSIRWRGPRRSWRARRR